MIDKPIIAVAGAVLVVAAGLAFYFHSRTPHLPAVPLAADVAPPGPPQEPPIEHPVPESSGAAAKTPLPTLADSDAPVKDALDAAAGASAIGQFLVPDNLIRHIVVTVDNLPRQKVPLAKRPVAAAPGSFIAQGDELHATLDAQNFARYEPLVNVVRALDAQRIADVYLHYYPLFQGVYRDLGYPNGYFNDRLVQVIDSLLATPQQADPIELMRPNVMYVFADPKLEALPAGQKILLRMGPDNAAVIKAKLTELRAIVTAAPPAKH